MGWSDGPDYHYRTKSWTLDYFTVLLDGLRYSVSFRNGKIKVRRVTHKGKFRFVWNPSTRERVIAEFMLTRMAKGGEDASAA